MRHVLLPAFKLLLAFVLFTQADYSLDPSRTIGQFHRTTWGAQDGGPTQIVALAQSKDGFLWIGTSRGLFSFDGIKFEKLAAASGTELPSDNIYSLMADDDGGLWVAFRPSGLGYIKNGQIEVFTQQPYLPSSQIYVLAVDGNGRVWGGTHNSIALRHEDGSWTEVGEEMGIPRRRVRSILTDRSGNMWVAVDHSIFVLRKGSERFEKIEDVQRDIIGLAEHPNGTIWVLKNLGSIRRVSLQSEPHPSFEIASSTTIEGFFIDRDGTLWFTDAGGLNRVVHPDKLDHNILETGDPQVDTLKASETSITGPFLEDREGNIWMGSPVGLHRFRYSCFVPNKVSRLYRNMTLVPDRENGVWIGSSRPVPLAHILDEEARMFSTAQYASSAYRASDGTVWWGRHSSLSEQVGNHWIEHPQPNNLKKDWMWEVFPDPTNEFLWVSMGDDGLVSFENGKWGKREKPSGLPDRGPSASFVESPNRVWLGYTENRVAILEGVAGRLLTSADGIDVGRVRVIRKGDDRIWIGGERGLSMFDGSRFHSVRTTNAGRFGTVSGIVFSSDGAGWLNEVDGIVKIPREEIERVKADPQHRVSVRRYDFEDGLPGSPQMNWTVSTAVETSDGRLWFATDGGLVSTDPLNHKTNALPPPIAISGLRVQNKKYNAHSEISLPQGTEDLSIEYTALSLSIPERVEFRYILDGIDPEWREAHSRREAFYTNLGPGSYTFRVVAANNDGVWNNEGATLTFRILPRFYQTNWFIGLCILAAAGIAFLILRWRVNALTNRMNLQFEERLAERGRIAQDLHDTLLQGFVGASMQMDVAVDALDDGAPQKSRFERIHEMIKRQISEGRETVKGLRSNSDATPDDLQVVFKRTRDELDHDHSVDFRVSLSGQPRVLHPIVHDEVRHIGQEAIFNAFRHSEAKKIDVMIEYSARRFYLRVKDDGRGIDQEFVSSGRSGHWGLTGMRERAEKIGGQLKIWTTEGHGTEIELIIPRRVAYEAAGKGLRKRISLRKFLWR